MNKKMPTNNSKTNNNASQMLFRFVSLRNPQLTEIKRSNVGLLAEEDDVKGVSAKVNGGEKGLKERVKCTSDLKEIMNYEKCINNYR
jgi:hypothetical protein